MLSGWCSRCGRHGRMRRRTNSFGSIVTRSSERI
jgi:hypothetical protein